MRKRKLVVYLFCIFIVAQVAANIGDDPVTDDPRLQERINAFKKAALRER